MPCYESLNRELQPFFAASLHNTQTGFEAMALAVRGGLRYSELQFATKLTHFHGFHLHYPTKCYKVAETKTI
jgi:hypothetical protein